MYTSTKRSSYVSQTTDLVSNAVFLGVRECTLVPRDQVTSVKQLILLAQQCFWACMNVHKYQEITLRQSNNCSC